jgi:ABC-2 type transport system permease protein
MAKVWSIAQYHFRQETGKRSFVLVLFSLPLFLALSVGLGLLFESMEHKPAAIGVVDPAGVLTDMQLPARYQGQVRLVVYDSPGAARAALESGAVDAYYALSPDFSRTRGVEMVYRKLPAQAATRALVDLVRQNTLAGQPPEVVERAATGAQATMRSVSARRDFPNSGPSAGQVVPAVAAVVFVFLLMTTAGYMVEALVSEKENRTIEVVVSSVSAGQMMEGKVLAILLIALMQLGVWIAFLAAAAWAGGHLLDVAWLRDIQVNWRDLLLLMVVAAPVTFCIAALMILVGTLLGDTQEANQAGGLLFLPLFLPVYLIIPIMQNAGSPLAIALSMFPLTSVMTLGIRSVFQEVAAWEFLASSALALLIGFAVLWVAVRTFRASMLRYGQRLDLLKALANSKAA